MGDDVERCGYPTHAGSSCRNSVDRAGRPCRVHAKPALLARLMAGSASAADGLSPVDVARSGEPDGGASRPTLP